MAVIIKGIDKIEPSAGTNSLEWAWQNDGPADGEVLIFGENGILTNGQPVGVFDNGSTADRAAPSAVYLRDNGISTNGTYWIDVNGTPTQIYCNFTHSGGGWMSFASSPADGWFNGNTGTTTWSTISYSHGTYDASGNVGHYWRNFSQQDVTDVMFLTGNSTHYLHLLLSDIKLSPNGSQHQVTVQGSNFLNSGCNADTTASVMFRSAQPEDPWINAGNLHAVEPNYMVWGENSHTGHGDFRQNNGGIIAFVR